jgi:hypothetical protein
MTATVDPLTDQRWAELVSELSEARPQPADALRTRVLATAAAPAPRRRPFPARRVARVLVPALAVALVAVGGVVGSRSAGSPAHETAAEPQEAPFGLQGSSAAEPMRSDSDPDSDARAAMPLTREASSPAPFAPGPAGRLQEQHVALGIRVPDVDALADATARAMEATRSLGGYVVAAHYDVPSPAGGDSTLVVRVPVGRVQEAIAHFTGLGTIVSQDVRLQDLQPAYDRRVRELEGLRERIGRLEQQLSAGGLTDEEQARLRTQLAAARRAVDARVAQQRAAEQQGRLARLELALTTRSADAAPAPDDGAAATLRAAAGIVGQMLVWVAAGLIVAGPFLAFALLAALAARTRRRVLRARLLERA